jgi:YHS domain-containing protein
MDVNLTNMKTLLKPILAAVLVASFALPLSGFAAEQSDKPADQKDQSAQKEKLRPYLLKTCIISGDKLGEMGKPFVYAYQGREIKFCCKSCLKDFNKSPAKYIKMIDEAEAKAKKEKGTKADAKD